MTATPWHHARRIAADIEPAPPQRVGLQSAIGCVLAQPVAALADLPPIQVAAVGGWAVRGIGPWTCVAQAGVLADGEATRIEIGGALPDEADAVLPEHASAVEETPAGQLVMVGDGTRPAARPGMIPAGSGTTPAGSWASVGELLIKPGGIITAGTVALAAAAGVDELTIIPPATVAPVMMGTDLLSSGPPRRGRDRDVVAPLLPSWVMGAGGRCLPETEGVPQPDTLANIIDGIGADLIVLTATSHPGVDPVILTALRHLRAEILIDRLATHPAEHVVLAEFGDGRRVLALPREPMAAVIVLALLLSPMMMAVSARTPARWSTVMLRDGIPPARAERAVVVAVERGELADLGYVQPWSGPHGLNALAGADGIAFLDPGRGSRGDSVPVIGLPGTG
jgi:molybdopterin molybdotransferase